MSEFSLFLTYVQELHSTDETINNNMNVMLTIVTYSEHWVVFFPNVAEGKEESGVSTVFFVVFFVFKGRGISSSPEAEINLGNQDDRLLQVLPSITTNTDRQAKTCAYTRSGNITNNKVKISQ